MKRLDEQNAIVWMSIRNPMDTGGSGSLPDFALLQSWRIDEEAGQYIVASHSISTDLVPIREGFARGEVLSSGFIVEEDEETSGCVLTYVGQLGISSMSIIVSELVGHSRLASARFEALATFLGTLQASAMHLALQRGRAASRSAQCSK